MPMPRKKPSAPAFAGCPLNEREVHVAIAALRALQVKPLIDIKAMAAELSYESPVSAKNSFNGILKKLGIDSTKLPPSNVRVINVKPSVPTKSVTKQSKDASKDELTADAPSPKNIERMTLVNSILYEDEEEDGGVPLSGSFLYPIPSVENCREAPLAHQGPEQHHDDDNDHDDDDGSVRLPQLSLDTPGRPKRAASSEPEGYDDAMHQRYEVAKYEMDLRALAMSLGIDIGMDEE